MFEFRYPTWMLCFFHDSPLEMFSGHIRFFRGLSALILFPRASTLTIVIFFFPSIYHIPRALSPTFVPLCCLFSLFSSIFRLISISLLEAIFLFMSRTCTVGVRDILPYLIGQRTTSWIVELQPSFFYDHTLLLHHLHATSLEAGAYRRRTFPGPVQDLSSPFVDGFVSLFFSLVDFPSPQCSCLLSSFLFSFAFFPPLS